MTTTTQPTIRKLTLADAPALERFLLPRIERSMFLLSNLRQHGLTDDGSRFTGTYTAAFESNAIAAVAAHYNSGVLIPQAPAYTEPLIAALLKSTNRPITGILGTEQQADPIIKQLNLERTPPSNILMNDRQGLFTLPINQLISPSSLNDPALSIRPATPADRPALIPLRQGFVREELGITDEAESLERANRDMQWILRGDAAWIVEHHGQPVGMTGFNASVTEAVQVGAVYTTPKHRSKGFAKAAVAQSLIDAAKRGATLAVLFVNSQNPAAQRAYTALGFKKIDNFRTILLRQGIIPNLTPTI